MSDNDDSGVDSDHESSNTSNILLVLDHPQIIHVNQIIENNNNQNNNNNNNINNNKTQQDRIDVDPPKTSSSSDFISLGNNTRLVCIVYLNIKIN